MRRAIAGAVTTTAAALAIMPMFPERIGANVAIVVIASLSWVLVALYGLRSRWQATRGGRAVLYLAFALAAFTTQVAVSVWIGSAYWGRNEIRFVLYFGLAVTIAHLIGTVVRAQKEDRR